MSDDIIHKGEISFFNYGNADFVDIPVTAVRDIGPLTITMPFKLTAKRAPTNLNLAETPKKGEKVPQWNNVDFHVEVKPKTR
jgi:hypothetical protein